MTSFGIVQIVLFLVVLAIVTPFFGNYMLKVWAGERVFLSPILRPIEVAWYKLSGIDEEHEQSWVGYAVALTLFSLVLAVFSYILLRIQTHLPLNPDSQGSVGPFLAFNSAVSFTSNTNWQNYAGEATLSYLSQMIVLARTNFTSGATGIAVAFAFIRGFSRHSAQSIGNFWVDVTRITVYIFIPVCVVLGIFFMAQGVPQTLGGAVTVKTLEGAQQVISRGPIAGQEAIKMLGSNGGGFMNTSSGHPFENPTPLSNFVQMVFGAIVAFGLIWTFGRAVGNVKQGLAILAAVSIFFVAGMLIAVAAEQGGNGFLTQVGISQAATSTNPGGNMEGKEVRFGAAGSAMYNAMMTGTSTGAVNSATDSYTPIGGMVELVSIKLGDITPGGAGNGLYGILMFAVVTVFVGGLMVGRTPEYIGKKIQGFEIKMATIGLLILPVFILSFAALSSVIPKGFSAISNPGPHGLSEILYAFASTVANNGSAFAGLSANTNYYNIVFAVAMWLGRFIFIVPILALAGSLAAKRRVPVTAGTLSTDTWLFAAVLVAVVILVGGLTMFPALSLGPIADHVQFASGQLPQ
jgi:potassium-transporting ATPase potassium-binding subunit